MTVKIITADNLVSLETAINAYTPPEGKVAGTPIQLAGGPWAVMIPLSDASSDGTGGDGTGGDGTGGDGTGGDGTGGDGTGGDSTPSGTDGEGG